MSGEKMKNPILDNISALLCTNCGLNEWKVEAEGVTCKSCGHHYPIMDNGKLVTVDKHIQEHNWEKVSDGFDLFKGNEKPIKVDNLGGPRIKDLRQNLGIKGIAINFGSGQDNYDDYINVDLGNYDPVNIIANLTKAPLVNGSVDLVVSNSVLEHIYDYKAVMDEVFRKLKSGGFFYLCVPNACLRHHKYDYHRWTTPGLHKLFEKRFEIIDSGACRGIAYALITYVEALLAYKIKNTNMLSASRWI
jgi:predicted SAM-dependent methyltransferase